jgi:hypothetical protein
MDFVADWRRISTSLELPAKPSRESSARERDVTQNCYIKTADSEVTAAMQQFERSLEYASNMHLSAIERTRLM